MSGPLDVVCEAAVVPIRDPGGEIVAEMHAYAYLADAEEDRPIAFFWNGGPGASAGLLHFGFAGPVRVEAIDGEPAFTPNELTLIDVMDLVYVDPIGTGLSGAVGDAEDAWFWGVETDAKAAAAFVEEFLEKRGMLDRPVVLCGESYGGIRIAAMLGPLGDRGIEPERLIMISPALDSRLLRPPSGSIHARRARADTMPSMAALAFERGLVDAGDVASFIDEAVEFAHGEYIDALEQGEDLPRSEIERLRPIRDGFTGGMDRDDTGRRDQHDARFRRSEAVMGGVPIDELAGSLRLLLSDVFEVETGGRYRLMNPSANAAWRAIGGRDRVFNSVVRTPAMVAGSCRGGGCPEVFIAGGWYDLVTPFSTNERLAAEGAFGDAGVTVRDYRAGHVIYADDEAHGALIADLRVWLSDG
ncbi:MAG: hypothetical protein AAFQ71_13320 [Planctomycetota bacterium]